MKIIGIYSITNLKNGKKYVGQSVNIKRRFTIHKHLLKKGTHYNKHLQNSYNKYGIDAFKFEILEECAIEELDKLEKNYIKKYNAINPKKGYNLEHGGLKNKRRTLESKMKRRGKWHHSISSKTKEDYAFRNHCTELWDTRKSYDGNYDDTKVRLPLEDINNEYDYDYNLKCGRNPDDYIVRVKEKHIDKFNIEVPDHYG